MNRLDVQSSAAAQAKIKLVSLETSPSGNAKKGMRGTNRRINFTQLCGCSDNETTQVLLDERVLSETSDDDAEKDASGKSAQQTNEEDETKGDP